jgi:hypothetical protein
MPYVFAKEPDPIAIWVAKWIFLPILIVALVATVITFGLDSRRCVAACVGAGYEFSKFSPRSLRWAQDSACTCSDHGILKQVPLK